MKVTGYVIRNTWLSGIYHGWGNGYVIIPNGHVLHGMHYDDIDVDVHGGLTYSSKNDVDDSWIIGFDTCHCNDNMENWSYENVVKETKELIQRIDNNDFKVRIFDKWV